MEVVVAMEVVVVMVVDVVLVVVVEMDVKPQVKDHVTDAGKLTILQIYVQMKYVNHHKSLNIYENMVHQQELAHQLQILLVWQLTSYNVILTMNVMLWGSIHVLVKQY